MSFFENEKYKNIEKIGSSFRDWKTNAEKIVLEYNYKNECKTIKKILKNYEHKAVLDLGCGKGDWILFFKENGFEQILGLDIAISRLKMAVREGYNDICCSTANSIPLKSNSFECIISNNMFLHILNDSDRIEIFNEIKRVLNNNGIFIFNFIPKYRNVTNQNYFAGIEVEKMVELINKSGLKILQKLPAYFMWPTKGAHPIFAKFSTKFVYPLTDFLFSKFSNLNNAKEVYFLISKS